MLLWESRLAVRATRRYTRLELTEEPLPAARSGHCRLLKHRARVIRRGNSLLVTLMYIGYPRK